MSANVLAVLPARAGSSGVPNKAGRLLLGKPLLAYTVEHLRAAKLVNRILVTTESAEIADLSASLGVEVIDRPAALAASNVPSTASVQHAAMVVTANGWRPDIVVELYPATPIRPAGGIDQCVQALLDNADATSAWALEPSTGSRHPAWSVALDADGFMRYPYEPMTAERQALPARYFLSSAAFAVRSDALFANPGIPVPYAAEWFFGNKHLGVVFPRGSTVDIDEPRDLLWAEFLLTRGQA